MNEHTSGECEYPGLLGTYLVKGHCQKSGTGAHTTCVYRYYPPCSIWQLYPNLWQLYPNFNKSS